MLPQKKCQIIAQARQDFREEGSLDGYYRYPEDPAAGAMYLREAHAIIEQDSREYTMGLTVKDSGGGDFELAPEDNHIAVCYSIVDLGVQPKEYQSETKYYQQVRFAWELTGALMRDGRPFSISRKYRSSLGSKANLRKDLQSWRGRSFTPLELEGFKLRAVLGAPCLLNVLHETNEAGQKYAYIGSISPLPKGMPKPMAFNPLFYFDMDDVDAVAKYNAMEDWMRKIINAETILQPNTRRHEAPPVDDFADEDIPF